MATTAESPRLITVLGPAAGEVYLLEPQEAVLGRDAANGIAIADPSLSRRHCAVVRDADGYVVRDLGSFNGTFVNGERVVEHRLTHGDRLRIGGTELLFHADHRVPPQLTTAEQPDTTSLRLDEAVYLSASAQLPERGRTQRDLHALVRVATTVAAIRDGEHLRRELLTAAFDVVPASEAAFINVDPGTEECMVFDTRTRDGRSASPPSDTVVGRALSKREAILTNTPGDDQQLKAAPSIAGRMVSSVLAVPVLDDQAIAGVLYLVTSDARTTFDRQHLELITAIAGIGSLALKNVSRFESMRAETERLKQSLGIKHQMIGSSEPMQQVYRFIERVSGTDSTVLITGETGTGKELAARAIHENGQRASWPFIAINCAAFADTLLESELFGHERGAFSGAIATKRGKLELADRGTVFLDEVGELSQAAQAKLLRVLQFRELDRVGGTRPIKVDLRIISATNRDLRREVAEGRFRQDLLYRLEVLTLVMPPLRERRRDIPALAEHFAAASAKRTRRGPVTLSPKAIRRLAAYDWPGNVRELENAIERAIVLGSDSEVGPDDLPEPVTHSTAADPDLESRFHSAVADVKRRIVREALDASGGSVTEAARLLGLHPNYLHRLLRNLGLRD
jgi:Nif-specific regulatory protein